MDIFLHCMSILAYMESQFDKTLLDIYFYYTVIGLGMTSPSLRASALSILAVVAQERAGLVISILGIPPETE